MKIFFTVVLILNLVIEAFAAFVLIGSPETMFPEGQVAAVMWARNYGFAALAVGTTVFWIWPHREDFNVVGTVLGILLTFQIAISVALGISGAMMGGMILHSIMAVLCIFLYTQRSKWCTK